MFMALNASCTLFELVTAWVYRRAPGLTMPGMIIGMLLASFGSVLVVPDKLFKPFINT
jgi:hypothetical protein